MPIDLDKFQRLRKAAEQAKSEADKAQGVYEDGMKRIRSELSVETLEEADAKLRQMAEEEKAAEDKYNAAMKDFEEKWATKV